MEQRGRELNSFEQLVEKAIDAKAKPPSGPAPKLAKPINTASKVVDH